jgi:beta-glucanase (GH16 family)
MKRIGFFIFIVVLSVSCFAQQPNCYYNNDACYYYNRRFMDGTLSESLNAPYYPYIVAIPDDDNSFDLATSYKLVFKEEFNGLVLDNNLWEKSSGVVRDFAYEASKHYFITSNIATSGGIASITARNDNTINDLNTSFAYTTGEFRSRFAFGYGVYEIKCKIPKGVGFWPSFWLFGAGIPKWEEIDVFEFWNEGRDGSNNVKQSELSKNQHMTTHYEWGSGPKIACASDYENVFGFGNYNSWTDYSMDFHTFYLEWHPAFIAWYVDGFSNNNIKRVNWKWSDITSFCGYDGIQGGSSYLLSKAHPFGPMNLYATLAIQNGNGNEPDNSTVFPSNFEIDEIAYYKQIPCPSAYYIPSGTGFVSGSLSWHDALVKFGEYNILMGTTIEIDGDFTLSGWVNNLYHEQWELQATDEIIHTGDFIAEDGSDYTARIIHDPCVSSRDIKSNSDVGKLLLTNDLYNRFTVKDLNLNRNDNDSIIFSVFPNPANNKIKILCNIIPDDWFSVAQVSIKIFSSNGNLVYCSQYLLNDLITQTLDLNLPNGIYYLSLTSDNNSLFGTKLIISE